MRSDDPGLMDTTARLRELPGLSPPRDAWPRIEARIRARRRARRVVVPGLALAASLVLALTLGVHFQRNGAGGPAGERAWLTQSQQLEQRLRELDAAGGVIDGGQAALMDDLEDRIAAVDLQLAGGASGKEADRLLARRVHLLSELVALHSDYRYPEESVVYLL